jgi:hypothetical protein
MGSAYATSARDRGGVEVAVVTCLMGEARRPVAAVPLPAEDGRRRRPPAGWP